MTTGPLRPFWPRGCPGPPAEVWSYWKETLVDYVNLLPLVNKVSAMLEEPKFECLPVT